MAVNSSLVNFFSNFFQRSLPTICVISPGDAIMAISVSSSRRSFCFQDIVQVAFRFLNSALHLATSSSLIVQPSRVSRGGKAICQKRWRSLGYPEEYVDFVLDRLASSLAPLSDAAIEICAGELLLRKRDSPRGPKIWRCAPPNRSRTSKRPEPAGREVAKGSGAAALRESFLKD
jgi:hypothetical protein